MLRASACKPDMAQPMCLSISTIFSILDETRSDDVTLFSTPSRTPFDVATPMAVEPSLIASSEYSTWKRRPSGEKVLLLVRQNGEASRKAAYLIPRSKKHRQYMLSSTAEFWLTIFRSCDEHLERLKVAESGAQYTLLSMSRVLATPQYCSRILEQDMRRFRQCCMRGP